MVEQETGGLKDLLIREMLICAEREKPIKVDIDNLRGFYDNLREIFGLEKEVSPEVRESLEASQFRAKIGEGGEILVYDRSKPKGGRWMPLPADGVLDSFCRGGEGKFEDRAFGVFSLLGREKFEALVRFAHQKGEELNLPRLVNDGEPQEGTRGRGILQTAADLIELAVLDDEKGIHRASEIVDRINRRMLKWLTRQYKNDQGKLEQVKANFVGVSEPKRTTSSFPPQLLGELFGLLAK